MSQSRIFLQQKQPLLLLRYNPLTNPATIKFDEEKVLNWLSKGAKPT
ncbi:MAG: 30S ribosomal protein S16, partial [Christensenellaceae bacterium]|nr:30S ribosomal protein S16 [Christensenellaceae bacterium]